VLLFSTAAGGSMTASGPARILVVDDEAAVGELLVQVLQRAGHQAVSALNGLQALDLLAAQQPDLMVTDLRMPGMGGMELVEHSRALHPDVDIMVLTAHATLESAIQALKLGAQDYIIKPFDVRDLTDKVNRCLTGRFERLAARHAPPGPLVALHKTLARSVDPLGACRDIIELISDWFVVDDLSLQFSSPWADSEPCIGLLGKLSGLPAAIVPCSAGELEDLLVSLVRGGDPWRMQELTPASVEETPRHALTVLVESGGSQLGVLRLVRNAAGGPYTESEAQSLYIFGAQLALAVLQARTRAELLAAFSDLSEVNTAAARTLVEALGAYDECTREHSQRVAEYARQLALRVGLGQEHVETIAIAGLLHDIGKLGVGGRTLRKSGRLTEAERERVLLHPVQGAQILSGMESLSEVVPLVRHHHERFDGTGYPDGLAGGLIPLGARILAVVDAYDSMTSDRPYRSTLDQREAQRRLSSGAGLQWDPGLVELWLDGLAFVNCPANAAAALEG
jgi:putative nucleotidyltransferase with HDIG domain